MLYRYKKGYNFMAYDRRNDNIFINYPEIWSVLQDEFDLNFEEIQGLVQKWLYDVYSLIDIIPYKALNSTGKIQLI